MQKEFQQLQLLRKGFDTLDVSFQGRLKPTVCDALRKGKELAQEQDVETVLVDFLGEKVKVGRRGMSGGYAFVVYDDLGTWFIKDKAGVEDYSAFVSVGSEAFYDLSTWSEVVMRIRYRMTQLFDGEVLDSVNRVDYCIDIIPNEDGFFFHPDNFAVKNFKGADVNENGQVRELKDEYKALAEFVEDFGLDETEYYRMSRKITGQRWGKMPNRQLNVYNKTIECRVHNKQYWFKEWQKAFPEIDARVHEVFRIESRAGKDCLKKYFSRAEDRTMSNVFYKIGAILSEAVQLVSYRIQNPHDGNKSRWKIHPLWEEIQEIFTQFDECVYDPENSQRRKRELNKKLLTGIEKQLKGTICTSAILNGCEDLDDLNTYLENIADEIKKADGDFEEARKKALRKYDLNNVFEVSREFLDFETGEVKRLGSASLSA